MICTTYPRQRAALASRIALAGLTTITLTALLALWASTTAAAVTTELVASGLGRPVFVTAPAGDLQRIFIVEQKGKILIVKDGVLLVEPFLDIQQLVSNGSFFDERGLLGLAFHPAFAANGFFYVNYTDNGDSTTIARYTVSDDPDLADPGSAVILMKIDQPHANHNGGTLAFSPTDGYLYIGMGDGGGAGDQDNRAQNDGTLLGKMLRIDVAGALPYAIPSDNPFVGQGDPRDEIWAKGLRNPYRWSFDRLSGDMYIADVGQDLWEEIDFQPAGSAGGENYGWRLMEGNHCFNPPSNCDPGGLTAPVHEFPHNPACSVTGGFVYRGVAIPELVGHYFFADWCSGQIWSFKIQDGQVTEFQERTAELAPGGGLFIAGISGFGEDGRGELYIVDRSAEGQGEVYKIVPVPTTVGTEDGGVPAPATLGQNHPNPFNPQTTITFRLREERTIILAVYRSDGRRVRTLVRDRMPAGVHETRWDGRDDRGRPEASGTYIYRLEAGDQSLSRRMTLLK